MTREVMLHSSPDGWDGLSALMLHVGSVVIGEGGSCSGACQRRVEQKERCGAPRVIDRDWRERSCSIAPSPPPR